MLAVKYLLLALKLLAVLLYLSTYTASPPKVASSPIFVSSPLIAGSPTETGTVIIVCTVFETVYRRPKVSWEYLRENWFFIFPSLASFFFTQEGKMHLWWATRYCSFLCCNFTNFLDRFFLLLRSAMKTYIAELNQKKTCCT